MSRAERVVRGLKAVADTVGLGDVADDALAVFGKKKAPRRAAPPKPQPTRTYTPEEQAVYERFGSKQQKEATRKSKVATGAGTGSRRRVSGGKGKAKPTRGRAGGQGRRASRDGRRPRARVRHQERVVAHRWLVR